MAHPDELPGAADTVGVPLTLALPAGYGGYADIRYRDEDTGCDATAEARRRHFEIEAAISNARGHRHMRRSGFFVCTIPCSEAGCTGASYQLQITYWSDGGVP